MNIKLKRLLAALIDYVCIFFVSMLISFAIMYRGTMMSFALAVVTCIVIFGVLYVFRDFVFRNASIGKKLLKIHIVSEKPQPLRLSTCICRAIPLLIFPIELLLVLKDNYRLGDMLSKTWVEECR